MIFVFLLFIWLPSAHMCCLVSQSPFIRGRRNVVISYAYLNESVSNLISIIGEMRSYRML